MSDYAREVHGRLDGRDFDGGVENIYLIPFDEETRDLIEQMAGAAKRLSYYEKSPISFSGYHVTHIMPNKTDLFDTFRIDYIPFFKFIDEIIEFNIPFSDIEFIFKRSEIFENELKKIDIDFMLKDESLKKSCDTFRFWIIDQYCGRFKEEY